MDFLLGRGGGVERAIAFEGHVTEGCVHTRNFGRCTLCFSNARGGSWMCNRCCGVRGFSGVWGLSGFHAVECRKCLETRKIFVIEN